MTTTWNKIKRHCQDNIEIYHFVLYNKIFISTSRTLCRAWCKMWLKLQYCWSTVLIILQGVFISIYMQYSTLKTVEQLAALYVITPFVSSIPLSRDLITELATAELTRRKQDCRNIISVQASDWLCVSFTKTACNLVLNAITRHIHIDPTLSKWWTYV